MAEEGLCLVAKATRPGVNLIRGSLLDDVLSDVKPGAPDATGDLGKLLLATDRSDRDGVEALGRPS
jgi:hypothetical protein